MPFTDASARRQTTVPLAPAITSGLITLGAVSVAVALDALWLAGGARLTREGGGVELMSALLCLVAGAAFLRRADGRGWFWPVPVLLAAMTLREFDADKGFTSEGLLGSKILARDTAVREKAVGVAVMTALAAALAVLLSRTVRPFLAALLRRAGWAVFAAGALALTVVTKSIDGLARKLRRFGVSVEAETAQVAGAAEEWLEPGIPVLLLMATVARLPTRRELCP